MHKPDGNCLISKLSADWWMKSSVSLGASCKNNLSWQFNLPEFLIPIVISWSLLTHTGTFNRDYSGDSLISVKVLMMYNNEWHKKKTERNVRKGRDSAGGPGGWCPFLLSLASQRDMKPSVLTYTPAEIACLSSQSYVLGLWEETCKDHTQSMKILQNILVYQLL